MTTPNRAPPWLRPWLRSLPYDAIKAFTPISVIATAPIVAVINPDLPAKSLKEFVALTRHLLNPGGRWLAMKGLFPHEEIAALPAGVKVSADHALVVPGLEASRHLIELEAAA